MKNPGPQFYLKWKNTIEIAVQENNYFVVFSAYLIKSININFFLYIFYFHPWALFCNHVKINSNIFLNSYLLDFITSWTCWFSLFFYTEIM